MEIKSNDVVEFPIDLVFTTLRDNLPEFASTIPNVKKVEVNSRDEVDDHTVRLVSRWYGKGEIPKVVRSVVKPEMISWLDTAVWDEKEHTCRWELETYFFKENVKCAGVNYYRAKGKGKTEIEITGNLEVTVRGIRGVPRLLERKIQPQIEKFIVKLVTPNLKKINEGLRIYLAG